MGTTAIMLTTSGSTGMPKIVRVSHAMALSKIYGTFSASDDILRFFAANPAGTITSFEIPDSIFYRSPRIFTAKPMTIDLVLNILQKHEVNAVAMLPFNITALYKRMQTENYNLSKLKTFESGGSILSEGTIPNLSKMLPNVEIGYKYGMTEFGLISLSNAGTKPGSTGYLRADISAKV